MNVFYHFKRIPSHFNNITNECDIKYEWKSNSFFNDGLNNHTL